MQPAIRLGCAQPLPHFSEGVLCRSRGNSSSGGGAGRGDLSKHVTVFVSSSPRKGDRDVCLTVLRQLVLDVGALLPRSPMVVVFDGPHPSPPFERMFFPNVMLSSGRFLRLDLGLHAVRHALVRSVEAVSSVRPLTGSAV